MSGVSADAPTPIRRLAILGLGLLGGSVALGARRAGIARSIVAAGRRPGPLAEALAQGVVDEVADIAGAVRGADLVVLSTPVGSMEAVLAEAARHLSPDAIVTDVGSVKGVLVDTLAGLLPEGVDFVGAHPMAGSHEKGVAHARADLFEGACCVITPSHAVARRSVERVRAFWLALGASVIERDPESHDIEAAWVSHLPHVLAFAYARALAQAPAGTGQMAGSGFRDFTRIANSDAELWTEILGANGKALTGPLQAFGRALEEFVRVLESGDAEAQERFLSTAHASLQAVSSRAPERGRAHVDENARSGGEIPEILADQEESADLRKVNDKQYE